MISIFGGFALFASAITAHKLLLGWLSPAFFVGIRMVSAGSLILLFYACTAKQLRFCRLRHDLGIILLVSTLVTFVPSVLKAYGLKYLVSSKTALLESLDPFITSLYAYFLWNEKLTRTKLLGMSIGFSGILFVLYSTSPLEEFLGGWSIFSLPELAIIASITINRYGWITARKLLQSERYKPSELNGLMMITGGLSALCYAWCCGNCNFMTIPVDGTFWITFAYSVFIGNIIGYTLYGHFIKTYNMTLITLCGLSIPLFVHLYGPLVLGERLSYQFFIALGIVFLGTAIFYSDELKKRKRR